MVRTARRLTWRRWTQRVPAREVDRPSAPGLRASDRDRDAAVELLSQAAGDGRLTLEEYSARADQALAARLIDELSQLTADLQRPGGATGRATPATPAGAEQLSAILGNESRKGHWRVPARLQARSVLGDCHIELQDAVLTSHVTVIEARATLGAITIFVPDGVEVRLSGKAIAGRKVLQAQPRSAARRAGDRSPGHGHPGQRHRQAAVAVEPGPRGAGGRGAPSARAAPRLTARRYPGAGGRRRQLAPPSRQQYSRPWMTWPGPSIGAIRNSPVHLAAGQLALLPGGTPHAATVPESAPAVTLNVFTHRDAPPGV